MGEGHWWLFTDVALLFDRALDAARKAGGALCINLVIDDSWSVHLNRLLLLTYKKISKVVLEILRFPGTELLEKAIS